MAMRAEEVQPREAARRIKKPLDYTYRLIWDGRLKARKQDGRWFVLVASIDAFKQAVKERKRRRRETKHSAAVEAVSAQPAL